MKNTFILIGMLLFSNVLYAGASQGKVSNPLVSYTDRFIFSAGVHISPPCSLSSLGSWVTDLTTEHGKAIQSLVMLAYAQGKDVHVQGKKSCVGDREEINFIYIVE